jgi:uncharacterized protein
VHGWTFSAIGSFVLALAPLLAFGFAGSWVCEICNRLPVPLRLALPATLGVPYLIVSVASDTLQWQWIALYFLLPIVVASILWSATLNDPQQMGDWRDFLLLLVLGLAVDLRWFDSAWPRNLRMLDKLVLLDFCLYGFLVIRQLTHVGLDLKLRARDLTIGLRETLFYAPISIPLGLALGFLHGHASLPSVGRAAGVFVFTFFLIALPEEIYFRGWIQNFLSRRIGRNASLLITAALFGLAHFNRRAAGHFNWRYVLLAAIAGIFYGRAWRQENRIGASALTHACVDTIWVLWLR